MAIISMSNRTRTEGIWN